MSESISTVSPLETIDAEQLCGLLHISMRTLKRWRQTGDGPAHVPAGRGYVYRTVTVLRWMEEREHVAATQKASWCADRASGRASSGRSHGISG